MERAILRPRNSVFSAMAITKPSSVEMPTTLTTQTAVFFITVPKALSCTAAVKLEKPVKPPTTPARLISLKASRNTIRMGKMTNTVIRIRLGSSHRYGSHLRRIRIVFMRAHPQRELIMKNE